MKIEIEQYVSERGTPLLKYKISEVPKAVIAHLDFEEILSMTIEDVVADNFATRGLILEILQPTTTGTTEENCYRAGLIRALGTLWD